MRHNSLDPTRLAGAVKFERKDLPVGTPVVGMVGGGQLARMTQEVGGRAGHPAARAGRGPDRVGGSGGRRRPGRRLPRPGDGTPVRRGGGRGHLRPRARPDRPAPGWRPTGVTVRPGPDALVHAQDKAVMRQRLDTIDAPAPAHQVVATPGGRRRLRQARRRLPDHPEDHPRRVRRQGRLGRHRLRRRGGRRRRSPRRADPGRGEGRLRPRAVRDRRPQSPHGQAVAYPVVESVQRDGICVEVTAPAPGLSPGQGGAGAADRAADRR